MCSVVIIFKCEIFKTLFCHKDLPAFARSNADRSSTAFTVFSHLGITFITTAPYPQRDYFIVLSAHIYVFVMSTDMAFFNACGLSLDLLIWTAAEHMIPAVAVCTSFPGA